MILGASGAYVCTVQIEQCGGGIIADAMEPERRANAALIVRCVNSYEIMKAALEEIAGDPTNLSSYQADLAKAARFSADGVRSDPAGARRTARRAPTRKELA